MRKKDKKNPLICPSCGAALSGHEEFCLGCGAKLELPAPPPEDKPAEGCPEDAPEKGRRGRRKDRKQRRRHRRLVIFLLILLALLLGVIAYLFLPSYLKKSVMFDADNGSPTYTKQVWIGKTIEKPVDPSKEGYNFLGWTLDGKSYNFNTSVKEDLLLKGVWERFYQITYMCQGKVVKEETAVEGTKLTGFTPEVEAGRFEGWTFNGNAYNFDAPVHCDIVLIADVTPECTVSFVVNEQNVSEQKLYAGDFVARPEDPASPEGSLFTGWSLNGISYDFTVPVSADITLVANFRNYVPLTGLSFSQSRISVKNGQSTDLKLVFSPANCTETEGVRFYTQDAHIATVSEDGTVTGVSVGSVIIYATLGDKICAVTVSVTK